MLSRLRTFARDDRGTVTVEVVIWGAFLVTAGITIGDRIVAPLADRA
jgi:hypothetical protein